MIKHYLPLTMFLLLAVISTAQIRHNKWELGLQGGVTQSQNDLNSFGIYENNIGGGLLLRYHLDNNIALRANIMYSEISGDDNNYTARAARGFRFSAPITEGSIVAELDFLGKRRWKSNGSFHRTISPYIYGGGGYTMSKPTVFYNEPGNEALRERINKDKESYKEGHLIMPLGLGVKIDITENWVIGLETGIRVLFDDYIDGVSFAGNSRRNDSYTFTNITATYRIPYISDRDRDGIADTEDACPDIKGKKETGGCPDTDGDGVADNLDNCPEEKGLNANGGCPDTDGDGIPDKSDQCPDMKGSLVTGGCSDKDKDGVTDSKDACPDTYGAIKLGGCPDSDGDGIKDADDKCPNEAGTVANAGCPKKDRDADGVLDDDDKCPDEAGAANMGGCPDSDADGIADALDKCPKQAGTATNGGCPGLSDTDKKILDAAIYGVQFEPAKSIIKTSSYGILDQVVEVLGRYPNFNLTINGHTDSDGTTASNQKLSDERAKACFDYFVSKGIAQNRMKYAGFGESKPVSDNTTKAGKSKNRRVEFELGI